jgi:hypothetical protein
MQMVEGKKKRTPVSSGVHCRELVNNLGEESRNDR